MKRLIFTSLVTVISCAFLLSAQNNKEEFNAYGKLHLGFTVEESRFAFNSGGSYGFYLGKHFGLGLGTALVTYHHQSGTQLIEGGGIEVFLESVLESRSRKFAFTSFGGIGFLNLGSYTSQTDDDYLVDEYAKKLPLLGIELDYYPREQLSLGIRTIYALLKDYSLTPQVRFAFSVGTRF